MRNLIKINKQHSILKIKLQNFRSYKEIELEESENINLLTPEEDTTGKKVIHEKYGKGVVVETSGNEITIDFGEEWGIKHLDVEWAPIKFE